jgi:serine/threonine protein kinase
VKAYLVQTFGIAADRLTTSGFGDTKPVGFEYDRRRPREESARGARQEVARLRARTAPSAGRGYTRSPVPGVGSLVSHYRLVRRLGAGGMGEVYLAQDESLDRPVAIKFLILPGDEQGRQRLLREARAAAALDHPAICAVYEVGTDRSAVISSSCSTSRVRRWRRD